jgi:hypothetical protein
MPAKNKLVSLSIASFVFLFGCQGRHYAPTPGQHYGIKDDRSYEVYIYANPNNPGQCLVDLDVATLWKIHNQTATWISDDGGDYFVDFGAGQHGSPFAGGATFPVSQNTNGYSGKITGPPGYYNYAIYLGKQKGTTPCKPADDPGFYVK